MSVGVLGVNKAKAFLALWNAVFASRGCGQCGAGGDALLLVAPGLDPMFLIDTLGIVNYVILVHVN